MGVAAFGLAVWLGLFIVQGRGIAFDASWLLLMVVALGGRGLLTRLRFSDAALEMSVGPWRRRADLTRLRSITFDVSGLGGSQGTLRVTDRSDATVSISVGRFARSPEWAAVLLRAVSSSGASVSDLTRETLEAEVGATGAQAGIVAGRAGASAQHRGSGSA